MWYWILSKKFSQHLNISSLSISAAAVPPRFSDQLVPENSVRTPAPTPELHQSPEFDFWDNRDSAAAELETAPAPPRSQAAAACKPVQVQFQAFSTFSGQNTVTPSSFTLHLTSWYFTWAVKSGHRPPLHSYLLSDWLISWTLFTITTTGQTWTLSPIPAIRSVWRVFGMVGCGMCLSVFIFVYMCTPSVYLLPPRPGQPGTGTVSDHVQDQARPDHT